MNEQYLFRGFYEYANGTKKIKVNGNVYVGEWVEGGAVKHWDGTIHIYHSEYISHQVIPETVGQFIGLTDKNGVKIFNKDRLRYAEETEIACEEEAKECPECYPNGYKADWAYGVVEWHIKYDCPAYDIDNHNFDCNAFSYLWATSDYEIEVIGTIFDEVEE